MGLQKHAMVTGYPPAAVRTDYYRAAEVDALLADIAAADRLARAADVASAVADTVQAAEYTRLTGEFMDALDAYRARMAQGVACGE